MDLHACIDEEIILKPGKRVLVPCGFAISIPSSEYAAFVFARSGLAIKHGITLSNGVGVIDSDYFYSDNEGHIFVKLTNDSNEGKTVELTEGTGFAQGIFLPYGITVDDAAEGKRNGGFGSTGK